MSKITDIIKGPKVIQEQAQNIEEMADNAKALNIKKIIDEAIEKIGQVNIIIAGKTGVGKSTLVNAVFKGNLAETGVGKPVTQTMKEYSKEGEPVHIFDTKGFELGNALTIRQELKSEIEKRKKSDDTKKQIHLAWFCISNDGKRVEKAEIEFINDLAKDIPVVVVLTKTLDTSLEFYNIVKDECQNATNVIRVLALPYETPIGTIPAFGLEELIEHTYEIVPDIAKAALAASQKVNERITKKAVDKIIAVAASSAAAVGATPIPFSDAVLLAPVQIGMMASITKVMKIDADRAFLTTLVSSAAGVLGATITGRAVVRGLIKCIPGAGSVIGGTISAVTASLLTTGMGYAYYNAVKTAIETGATDAQSVAEDFKKELKKVKF
ncbi:MAG: 50S ribosome-binding GTPase [Bacteroidaceae bacterium]|nr:50S ribosome-binding GTPase [Bacteroidaceae bacterium]